MKGIKETFILSLSLSTFILMVNVSAQERHLSKLIAVSGGSSLTANNERYYEGLERVNEVYQSSADEKLVFNYVSSGNGQAPALLDYYSENIVTGKFHRNIEFKRLRLDPITHLPHLIPRTPVGGFSGGASFEELQNAFRSIKTFDGTEEENGPLIFYVTGHGLRKEGDGEISLWDGNNLNVPQLRSLIDELPSKQKIVLLMDQCYGGNMLKALWDDHFDLLRPGSCGVAAAGPEQLAFSTGGIMKKIYQVLVNKELPLGSTMNLDSIKDVLSYKDLFKILIEDNSIRSTPILSSDLFAKEWLRKKFPDGIADDKIFGEEIDEEEEGYESDDDQKNFVKTSGNNKYGVLKEASYYCLSERGNTYNSIFSHIKGVPREIVFSLKEYWNELNEELLQNLTVEQKNQRKKSFINDLINDVSELEREADQNFSDFRTYQQKKYNRLVRLAVKQIFPHYSKFLGLKKRLTKGETLSTSEIEEYEILKLQHSLYREAVKNTASLASKNSHAILPFETSKELRLSVKKFTSLQSSKNKSINKYFRVRKTLDRLITLRAVFQIVQDRDWRILSNYLDLKSSERQKI